MRRFRKWIGVAALTVVGTAGSALGQWVPETMPALASPVDIDSVATAVLTLGASVLVAVLGIWLAFKLIKKGARALGRGV